MQRDPFAVDEWFHCYGRGIDKRNTFKSKEDYERFVALIYLANSSKRVHISNQRNKSLRDIFALERGDQLVSIGAFCLMSNHFHLLLKEVTENGISTFMQKLGTAYTMYFNLKHSRTGGLFVKPFRSRHVHDDTYFQWVLQYIHCNPAEITEPGWKVGRVENMVKLTKALQMYPYSSYGAFLDLKHPVRKLLGADIFSIETQRAPEAMLSEAREFYASNIKATP